MQRLGGGGYTRKRKQRGAGNDPTCGCDMQAGWPKFLTENIPLPSVGPSLRVGSPEAALTQPTGQKGGASCGIPPIPNYYQGGAINMNKSYSKSACPPKQQRGGACGACSGLPLPTPLVGPSHPTIGGGQPTYYNSNPVPDACPFPGTGYCGFYARGGSSQVNNLNTPVPTSYPLYSEEELSSLLTLYQRRNVKANNGSVLKSPTLDKYLQVAAQLRKEGVRPINEAAVIRRIEESGSQNVMTSPLSAPGKNKKMGVVQQNKGAVQQGGANYGEPMYLQARLRGGGCGCNARRGGYRPTKKNLAALKKWRKGQSIGFTMTSSLKAKGLIPRTSRKHRGKKVVSAKYK